MTTPGRNDPCPCGSGKKYKFCCGSAAGHLSLLGPSVTLPVSAPPQAGDAQGVTLQLLQDAAERLRGAIGAYNAGTPEDPVLFLDQMLFGPDVPPANDSPELFAAQDLMYQAWMEPNQAKRVRMARRAIELSPDCADAYYLLALDDARGLDAQIALFEQGVAAGERALGPAFFEAAAGSFWGIVETRPYMRARGGLAFALLEAGRRDEAIEHMRELLRLNPGDNQGIRYELLSALIAAGHLDEATGLVGVFSDDASAYWHYTGALLRFRLTGETVLADRRLATAVAWNPHVPAYLLGRKRLPRRKPDSSSPGANDEAIFYTEEHGALWRATPGALDWLRRVEAGELLRPRLEARYKCFENAHAYAAFTRCPDCDAPTKLRQIYLVVELGIRDTMVVKLGCRVCDASDLLIVRLSELERAMIAVLQPLRPELIGCAYGVIGTIEPATARQFLKTDGPFLSPKQLSELVHFCADYVTYEPSMWGWEPPESLFLE
jgi:tetratricopeptide (TPR) repeat protein